MVKKELIEEMDMKKLNEKYHDMEAKFYDKIHLHFKSAYEQGMLRSILSEFGLREKKILDIASGTGFVIKYILTVEPRAKIYATDISKNMLARLREKFGKSIITKVCDVEKLPFSSNSMDLVTVSSGMHHLQNYKKVISEVHRVLKQGCPFFVFHEPAIIERSFPSKILDKFYYTWKRYAPDTRKKKVKKYANKIFQRGEEESYRLMQKINEMNHIHKGFVPEKLLGSKFKIIKKEVYFPKTTFYFKMKKMLFPKEGELFYVVGIKK